VSELLRTPLFPLESEMAVLGAVLLGKPATFDQAAEIVGESDFYRVAHQHVWAACAAVREAAPGGIDYVAVKNELERRGQLDEVGGIVYLMSLAEFVPTDANIAYHADIVREKSIKRALAAAAGEVAGLAYADQEDADALAAQAEDLIRKASAAAAARASAWAPLSRAMDEEMQDLSDRYQRQQEGQGLLPVVAGQTTGIADLDHATGGMADGDLVLIVGPSGMGKTVLGTNIAAAAARSLQEKASPGVIAFFSLEMSRKQIARRCIGAEARVDSTRLRDGLLDDAEWSRVGEAIARQWDWPLWIDPTRNLSVADLPLRLRRLQDQAGPVRMVLVDYVQRLRPPQEIQGKQARYEAVGQIGRDLKTLAAEFACPVLAMAAVNRGAVNRADKRPVKGDLRESDDLVYEADLILGPYRPAYYEHAETGPGSSLEYEDDAEIVLVKNRHGGEGLVRCAFWPKYSMFTDRPYSVF